MTSTGVELAGEVRQRCPWRGRGARSGAPTDRAAPAGVRGPVAAIDLLVVAGVGPDRGTPRRYGARRSEAASAAPGLVEARGSPDAGRTQSPIAWNAMPRAVRSSARSVSATGVSAMTRVSASTFVDVAGQRRRGSREPGPPAEDDDDGASSGRRRRANALASGPSAALWDRPPATTAAAVTIVTSWPASTRCSAVPSPRQSSTSSRTSDALAAAGASPSSTSGSRDVAPSDAGQPVAPAAAPAGTRCRGGRDPVATMTSSATRSPSRSPALFARRAGPPPRARPAAGRTRRSGP